MFGGFTRSTPLGIRGGVFGSLNAVGVSILMSSMAMALGDGKVHIYAIDCGQGSGSIIIGPTGLSVMADGGAADSEAPDFIDAMNDAIAAGLTNNTLDYIIVSHLHTDHLMCFNEVYDAFPGGLVAAYDRGGTYSSGAYTTYNNKFGTPGLNKRMTGASFNIGGTASMTYLGRGGGTSSDENNYGVVYKLSYGNFQGWFGGDLGQGFEAAHGQTCGKVEFYHVDHHGSSTSSEATFLSYIQPKTHVFSYGVGNSYGHPTSAAASRLTSVGSVRFDTPTDHYLSNNYVHAWSDGVGKFYVNGTSYFPHEPIATPTPTPSPTPSPSPSPVPGGSAWINEIHYDNTSTDANEGVEVAGASGTSLTGWSIVAYNGNGGASYSTTNLSGSFTNQQGGYGTLWFAIADLQNGSPDGLALVNSSGTVVQFLSYEGAMTAVGGPANGMTSTNLPVQEDGTNSSSISMQLQGSGHAYSSFTWNGAVTATRGAKNTGQTFN